MKKVVDAYGTERSLAESVVFEFTDALGWKINIQMQEQGGTSQSQLQQPKPAAQPEAAKPAGSLVAGQRNVRFGKYDWRVLDVQNGKALLLTEDVIEERRYHSSREGITWEGCELREYLNGAFLQNFGSPERSRIAPVTNTNPDNPLWGTPGGRNTADKVFLLSIDEVVKYFGDSGDLQARKGWYWDSDKQQYVLKDGKGYYIYDQYNEARIAKYGGRWACWWLRSPGNNDLNAAVVNSFGCLHLRGIIVLYGGGVRPALWLNL